MKRTLYLLSLLPFTLLTAQSSEDLSFSHHVDELAIKDRASIHGFGDQGAILAELVKGEKMKRIKLTFFYTPGGSTDSIFIPISYFDFLHVTKDSNNLYLLVKDGPEAQILSVNFQTRTVHTTVVNQDPDGIGTVTHFAVLGDIAYLTSYYNVYGSRDALLQVGLRDSFYKKQILTTKEKSRYKEFDLRVSQEQDEVYFFHAYYIRGGNVIKTYVFKKDGSLNFSRVCYRTDSKDEVYAPVLKRVSDDRYVFIASIREVDTMVKLKIFELPGGPVTTGFVALTMSRDTFIGKQYVHFRNFKDFPNDTIPSERRKARENDYWKGTVRCERIELTGNGNLLLHANCFRHHYASGTITHHYESNGIYSKEVGTTTEEPHFPEIVLFGQVNAEVDSSFNILCDHLHPLTDENHMIYNRNYTSDIWRMDRYIPTKDKCSSVYQNIIYHLYLDYDINSGERKKKTYFIFYGKAREIKCE